MIKNNDFQSVDSTYTSDNRLFRYYYYSKGNKDSIIIERDSIFTKIMKNGKLSYKNSYYKSDLLYEKYYNDGILKKRKNIYSLHILNIKMILYLKE